MFVFDSMLGSAELSQLSENWARLDDGTKANISAVFNRQGTEEFYLGAAAALQACAKLLTDKNYPESAKPTVVIGALAYVASKLSSGRWPHA